MHKVIEIKHHQFEQLKQLTKKDEVSLTLIEMIEEANKMGAITQTGFLIGKEMVPYIVLSRRLGKDDKTFSTSREYELWLNKPEEKPVEIKFPVASTEDKMAGKLDAMGSLEKPKKDKPKRTHKKCPGCQEMITWQKKICACGHGFGKSAKKPETVGA